MLEDVNDEIPLFTEREQETVLEGEPIGTKVTQVNAIDKDGTFPNNQVIFCIHSYNYCPNFHDNLYNISTISTIFNNIRNEKAQTDLSHFLIVMQHAVFLVRKRLDIFFFVLAEECFGVNSQHANISSFELYREFQCPTNPYPI